VVILSRMMSGFLRRRFPGLPFNLFPQVAIVQRVELSGSEIVQDRGHEIRGGTCNGCSTLSSPLLHPPCNADAG
jgi:hypothetical protein